MGISPLDYATFPISYDSHLKYKYLISIDGNGAAWLRVPWIMHSNSLLIKQESSKVQWFYGGLKPHVHYCPLNKDINDTLEVLHAINGNPGKVKEII
jgi:hypothetical protein